MSKVETMGFIKCGIWLSIIYFELNIALRLVWGMMNSLGF